MKNLLTVTLMAGLLSIPSMVFADASWYGSIRTGVASTPHDGGGSSTGVSDISSRWGIQGSSKISEELTAVYRFETMLDSTDATMPGGRLSYVGLSGGFGTITIGQVWSASYNSVGAMTDNSFAYGDSETIDRVGGAVSYSVSVGNISLQADVIMDSDTKKTGDVYQDAYLVGATIGGLMESGSIAIAHIRADVKLALFDINDDMNDDVVDPDDLYDTGVDKKSSDFLVGQYGIGDMTMYIGVGKHKTGNDGCDNENNDCVTMLIGTTTFAGIRGGVGDTGISYVFQMRKVKSKTTDNEPIQTTTTDSISPWILGISRSLGGGASVHFETSDPDKDGISNSTGVWLKVDF